MRHTGQQTRMQPGTSGPRMEKGRRTSRVLLDLAARDADDNLGGGLHPVQWEEIVWAEVNTKRDVLVVQKLLQHLARLESQNTAGTDCNLLARLRVAAGPGRLVADEEVAEPGDFDFLPGFKRLLDGVENKLDNFTSFFLGKATALVVHRLDYLCLGHVVLTFAVAVPNS